MTRDPLWSLVRTDPRPARRRCGVATLLTASLVCLAYAASLVVVGFLIGVIAVRGAS